MFPPDYDLSRTLCLPTEPLTGAHWILLGVRELGTQLSWVPFLAVGWVMRAWRVNLRQAGAVGYRLRKGDCVNSGELDTEELLIWSHGADVEGEEPAFSLRLPGTGDLCHVDCVLAAGPVRIKSAELPNALRFVFARLGIQFCRQSVISETKREWRDGLTVFTRVSRHSWLRISAMDSGMFASLCAWSLVSGLGPWCQPG